MWFESFEYFDKMTEDGRIDSHSDYSALERVVMIVLKLYNVGSAQTEPCWKEQISLP